MTKVMAAVTPPNSHCPGRLPGWVTGSVMTKKAASRMPPDSRWNNGGPALVELPPSLKIKAKAPKVMRKAVTTRHAIKPRSRSQRPPAAKARLAHSQAKPPKCPKAGFCRKASATVKPSRYLSAVSAVAPVCPSTSGGQVPMASG